MPITGRQRQLPATRRFLRLNRCKRLIATLGRRFLLISSVHRLTVTDGLALGNALIMSNQIQVPLSKKQLSKRNIKRIIYTTELAAIINLTGTTNFNRRHTPYKRMMYVTDTFRHATHAEQNTTSMKK